MFLACYNLGESIQSIFATLVPRMLLISLGFRIGLRVKNNNSWKTPGRWLRGFSHLQQCDVRDSADMIFFYTRPSYNNRMHSRLAV
jgi:hypothetical protein